MNGDHFLEKCCEAELKPGAGAVHIILTTVDQDLCPECNDTICASPDGHARDKDHAGKHPRLEATCAIRVAPAQRAVVQR